MFIIRVCAVIVDCKIIPELFTENPHNIYTQIIILQE